LPSKKEELAGTKQSTAPRMGLEGERKQVMHRNVKDGRGEKGQG